MNRSDASRWNFGNDAQYRATARIRAARPPHGVCGVSEFCSPSQLSWRSRRSPPRKAGEDFECRRRGEPATVAAWWATLFRKPLLSAARSLTYRCPTFCRRAASHTSHTHSRRSAVPLGLHPISRQAASSHRGKTLDPACLGALPELQRASRDHRGDR